MSKALELAEIAASNGEVPVGAVVVKNSDGAIVGHGYNRREADRCALSHAEMLAVVRFMLPLNRAPCAVVQL